MFTRHGHHIPGTDISGKNNRKIALCGGIHLCELCMIDVQKAQYQIVAPKG